MNCYRFSIIIVTWNAIHHLKNFLPSVTATDYPDFEIIIADNASNDGTKDWLEKSFPDCRKEVTKDAGDQKPYVRHVMLTNNYGYCGGNNRAVRHATGDILIFLNNDVEVTPDWLQSLNELFQNNQEVAAAQPKLLSYQNRDEFEYAGAAGGFIDAFGYPFCRGRLFDTVEQDQHQYDKSGPIFWASGAALAIRRSLFEESGGFDEDFEFHMEEIDLCWRLQNRGYSIHYVPESTVYHLGGGSLQMGSPRKITYNFRNNLLMLWKNERASTLWSHLPVRFFLDFLAALRSLLTFHFREFLAVVKAYLQFIDMLPVTHKKRKQSVRNHNAPKSLSGKIPVSIVWQYFIRGKRLFSELPDTEEYL